jgi:hypothetical protein
MSLAIQLSLVDTGSAKRGPTLRDGPPSLAQRC